MCACTSPDTIIGVLAARYSMPTYVTLFNWTDQGVRDAKNAPGRFEAAKKLTQSAGGKVLGLYVTMGEYDVVAVIEGPDDETAAAVALSIAAKGNAKTLTMRAFTEQEFAGILKKVV
jgi:uncharacterized protein with GYD domain